MSQTTQKLTECNRCLSAGFPNQMIGFVKSDRKKSDGRPFWDLKNPDMTDHVHKSGQQVVLSEKTLQENSQNNKLVIDAMNVQTLNAALKELAYSVSTLCLTLIQSTEEERQHIKERISKNGVNKK